MRKWSGVVVGVLLVFIATSMWEVGAAAPKHPYVKSIDCDAWRNHYVNCMVTTWNRQHQRYVTYSLSDKRVVYCFDLKLTDCVLRVWHPRLEKYRFYWDLSVNVTRISGGAIDSGSAIATIYYGPGQINGYVSPR